MLAALARAVVENWARDGQMKARRVCCGGSILRRDMALLIVAEGIWSLVSGLWSLRCGSCLCCLLCLCLTKLKVWLVLVGVASRTAAGSSLAGAHHRAVYSGTFSLDSGARPEPEPEPERISTSTRTIRSSSCNAFIATSS